MGKVLLVDDAVFMRKMLSDVLIKGGHEIIGEASNGEEAYAKYKELQPDVVTMDITMPVCDGLEGVKKIMKDFPNAKIIMCSAMGQQAMVLDAIQSGAKDFIVKPFQADRVLEAINKVIR